MTHRQYISSVTEREIPKDSDEVSVQTKRDTLERFIRNNRNVNIISYDELYRRAYNIAHGEPVEAMKPESKIGEPINLDDVDF